MAARRLSFPQHGEQRLQRAAASCDQSTLHPDPLQPKCSQQTDRHRCISPFTPGQCIPTSQLQHQEEVAAHADPYADLVHPQEPGVDLQQESDQRRLTPAGIARRWQGDGRGKQAWSRCEPDAAAGEALPALHSTQHMTEVCCHYTAARAGTLPQPPAVCHSSGQVHAALGHCSATPIVIPVCEAGDSSAHQPGGVAVNDLLRATAVQHVACHCREACPHLQPVEASKACGGGFLVLSNTKEEVWG